MKSFVKVVQDINAGLNKILLFPAILNALILFLFAYLILSLIDFLAFLAFIPAAAYFGYALYRKSRINKIRLVEIYYPELNEKLRTAADYANAEGMVVDELHQEVAEDIKRVYTSSFFETGKNSTKIVLSIILCFLILFFSSLNLPIDDYKMKLQDLLQDVTEAISAGGSAFSGNSPAAGRGGKEDIFGDKSLAELGKRELEVEIKPATFDLNIRNVGEAEELPFASGTFPPDAIITAASTYQENIPREQQEIVKNYFKKLTEG